MKCIVSYNQIVVKSDCTLEEFQHAKQLNPENVILRDDKDKFIYAVAFDSQGDVSQNGITFDCTNNEGHMYTALYACLENATLAEKKEVVKEKLAPRIKHIEAIERKIKEADTAYYNMMNDAENKIVVMED